MGFRTTGATIPKKRKNAESASKTLSVLLPRHHSSAPSTPKITAIVMPNLRKSFLPLGMDLISSRIVMLIELEFLHPVGVLSQWFLVLPVDQKIFNDQVIHVRAHETAVSILRRANDRFAAHI